MQIPKLTCFDAGARNGLKDLVPLSPYISLYSFEPNILANDALNNDLPDHYAKHQVKGKGLFETSGNYDLYVMANPSMSSMLEPDWEILNEYFDRISEFRKWRQQLEVADVKKIEVTTIDAVLVKEHLETIDYLKIDTQGTELAILKGGHNALKDKKIIVIKTEFAFIPLYKNQPTFSDIDSYLKNFAYKLVSCEFKYDIISPFIKKGEKPKFGIGGDAFYCIDFDKINDDRKMLKAAVVLGGLGFISNASHLFKKLNVTVDEQKVFYTKTQRRNKKTVLRYFLPPFIIDLYRKFKK